MKSVTNALSLSIAAFACSMFAIVPVSQAAETEQTAVGDEVLANEVYVDCAVTPHTPMNRCQVSYVPTGTTSITWAIQKVAQPSTWGEIIGCDDSSPCSINCGRGYWTIYVTAYDMNGDAIATGETPFSCEVQGTVERPQYFNGPRTRVYAGQCNTIGSHIRCTSPQ